MQTKSVPFELKAGSEKGTFEALVAVFGNVDSVGDRIVRGAFAKSLAQWRKSGDPIPVIFNHDWSDAHAHIGVVDEAKETPGGLLVKGTLDVEDNNVARQVHRLMQRRSLKEFSFGYRVPEGGQKLAKDGVNELLEIDLVEVGPTLKGANSATELRAVKSALGVQDPPRDASELREEATRVEREVEEQQVPDVPEPQIEPPEELQEVQVPKSAEELRKQATKVERELQEQQTPEVTEVVEVVDAEPVIDLAVELEGVKSQLAELREALKPPEKTPAELEAQAKSVALEVEQATIPEVPEPPEAPDPKEQELQEVKSQLAEMRQMVEDLKKKAEETDKEPRKARSVDPLRQQAEAVALEVASGGLRQPPIPPAVPKREPSLSLEELKQRTRDEMLSVLSGTEVT